MCRPKGRYILGAVRRDDDLLRGCVVVGRYGLRDFGEIALLALVALIAGRSSLTIADRKQGIYVAADASLVARRGGADAVAVAEVADLPVSYEDVQVTCEKYHRCGRRGVARFDAPSLSRSVRATLISYTEYRLQSAPPAVLTPASVNSGSFAVPMFMTDFATLSPPTIKSRTPAKK